LGTERVSVRMGEPTVKFEYGGKGSPAQTFKEKIAVNTSAGEEGVGRKWGRRGV